MQNENWYAIVTLILNILTAIGTIGAVGISLYYSYKAQKKEHQFLEIESIGGLLMQKNDKYYLIISFRFNNFVDKDIIVNSIDCAFWYCGFAIIDKYQYTIPAYGRNSYISIEEEYDNEKERSKDINALKKKLKHVDLHIDTNIGLLYFKLPKKRFTKALRDILKMPEIKRMKFPKS